MFKRIALAVIALVLMASIACADSVYGLATTKLATRTGPGTEFTEPGTFRLEDEYIKLISIAYDVNNVPWVQCDIKYGGKRMRVYTGLKRFDTTTFDVYELEEEGVYGKGKHHGKRKLKYGPGNNYADQIYTITNGRRVTIISEENDWYQVEYTTDDGPRIRGWVPASKVY